MMVFSTNHNNLSPKCFEIGRQIPPLEEERAKLQNDIFFLEQNVRTFRLRILEIKRELERIFAAQATARAAGSRGGLKGAAIGEALAQAMEHFGDKAILEEERRKLKGKLSAMEERLPKAKRRLSVDVEHNLSELRKKHRRLGCAASTIPFQSDSPE